MLYMMYIYDEYNVYDLYDEYDESTYMMYIHILYIHTLYVYCRFTAQAQWCNRLYFIFVTLFVINQLILLALIILALNILLLFILVIVIVSIKVDIDKVSRSNKRQGDASQQGVLRAVPTDEQQHLQDEKGGIEEEDQIGTVRNPTDVGVISLNGYQYRDDKQLNNQTNKQKY